MRNVISLCKLKVNFIVGIDFEQVTVFSVTNQTLQLDMNTSMNMILFVYMNETEWGMGKDWKRH